MRKGDCVWKLESYVKGPSQKRIYGSEAVNTAVNNKFTSSSLDYASKPTRMKDPASFRNQVLYSLHSANLNTCLKNLCDSHLNMQVGYSTFSLMGSQAARQQFQLGRRKKMYNQHYHLSSIIKYRCEKKKLYHADRLRSYGVKDQWST